MYFYFEYHQHISNYLFVSAKYIKRSAFTFRHNIVCCKFISRSQWNKTSLKRYGLKCTTRHTNGNSENIVSFASMTKNPSNAKHHKPKYCRNKVNEYLCWYFPINDINMQGVINFANNVEALSKLILDYCIGCIRVLTNTTNTSNTLTWYIHTLCIRRQSIESK